MGPLLTAVLVLAMGTEPTADAGTPPDGAALFVKLQCAVCHALEKPLPTAPSLRNRFGGKTTLRDGTEHRFDETYVRESILNPAARVAKGFLPIMPPFRGRVTEAELQALVAFVRSLSPDTPNWEPPARSAQPNPQSPLPNPTATN